MEEAYMHGEIEISEDDCGKMSWILDKALTIGKKVLITGFVITSAPVVLPPLVVISTIGFVCTVPYGLLFASYACTQKVMSMLLPGQAPPSLVEYEPKYNVAGGGWEEGQEAAAFGDTSIEDVGDQLLEEPKGGAEMRQQPPRQVEEEADVSDADLYAPRGLQRNNEQVEIVKETDETDEQKPAVVEVSEIKVVVEGDVERNGSKQVEPTCEVMDVSVEIFLSDDKEDSEIVRETRGLIETIGNKDQAGIDIEQHKRSAENAYVGVKEGDKGLNGNAKEVGVLTNLDAREIADESGFDIFNEKAATTQQHSADPGMPKGTEPSKVLKQAGFLEITIPRGDKVVENTGIRLEEDITKISNKVLCSEEDIWKQIHAVGAIVGYTGGRRATCIEELKSLYIFTGVEPPSTFKYPTDLEEINDKLRFLMSIVGVK